MATQRIVFGTHSADHDYHVQEHEFVMLVTGMENFVVKKCKDCENATPHSVIVLTTVTATRMTEPQNMRSVYTCIRCGSLKIES